MRHYFTSGPVAAHPGGMRAPATKGPLIAPACLSDGLTARPRGAAVAAVDLAPVAAVAAANLWVGSISTAILTPSGSTNGAWTGSTTAGGNASTNCSAWT